MNQSEIDIAELRAQYIYQILEILNAAQVDGIDKDGILRDVAVLAELPNR